MWKSGSGRPKVFQRKTSFESISCVRIFTAKGNDKKSGEHSDCNNGPFAERPHREKRFEFNLVNYSEEVSTAHFRIGNTAKVLSIKQTATI
ncbi:hypothetical protein J2T20_003440 [Paenibacillus wynnii]|nr:hypothetical protein [Paenibacillus wynnii]